MYNLKDDHDYERETFITLGAKTECDDEETFRIVKNGMNHLLAAIKENEHKCIVEYNRLGHLMESIRCNSRINNQFWSVDEPCT
jgi:hypothetical protein